MYFAIITMATVGYGDIHAVNLREMIFIMIYVSFDMVLGAYLIGNMTALIVKGSKTEKFRDKMTDLIKYMNRNRLGRDIRDQIKGHMRLQYESNYTEASVLQDIPVSIRAKISQTLYMPYIEKVSLFKGCSSEFINQIVIRLHEEFFLPGEDVGVGEDGSEETVSQLQPNSSFGEVSILCNIPRPYTVRICELSRLLRIDKQSFTKSNLRLKQLESDITFHIGKHEAELALRVNSAAYHGDLYQLKGLIRAGADLNKTNYDGRSPLHLATSRGYEDITLFLIQKGVDTNIKVKEGASLNVDDAGSLLCTAVARGDSDFLKRVLSNGVDPNSRDYDHRTPLHVAASEGLYLMVKLLLEAGASVFTKDRWGNTPLDEGRMCGNKNLIKLLEDAKCTQLKKHPRKCTVFPFHPWDEKMHRRHGIVLWVPHNIEELIKLTVDKLDFPGGHSMLLEDGGKILNVDMINDGQKLYLISETQ
ncbi:Potassium channel SKOR [Citrus sinensis]|nr:Potassium channel SKOR [Citrus sinensis]